MLSFGVIRVSLCLSTVKIVFVVRFFCTVCLSSVFVWVILLVVSFLFRVSGISSFYSY